MEGSQPDGNPVAVKPLEFTFLNQENSNLCVLASLIHALQFAIPVFASVHRTLSSRRLARTFQAGATT